MFEQLDERQKQELDNYRTTWFKIATDTGLADRPTAEAAIARMYEIESGQAHFRVVYFSPRCQSQDQRRVEEPRRQDDLLPHYAVG